MRKNIALSFLQKHLQLVVSIGTVMVLSRLISPEETGIFSIGVAIAALTHAVRDFGVGNFLIKETEVTAPKMQTAFTVSFIIALVLSIALFIASFPVAAFYEKPEVAIVIWITTGGLLISPLSTINMALLLREHRFGAMLKASMAGAIVNGVVSIALAWMGMGAKALAFGQLASAVALVVVSNLEYRGFEMYRFSLQYWRQISNFGMHMTVFGLTEQMGGRATDLVVGKLIGFDAVGLLSRSSTLIGMVQDSILNSVTPVVLTNMADNLRKTGEVLPLMLKSLQYFTVVLWPVFAVIALCSHDAIMVLFGAKWIEVAPYTSVLCAGAAIGTLSSLTGIICNVTNRASLLSRYSTICQAIRVPMLAAGAFTGKLMPVVVMLVLADAIQCVLAFVFVRRAVPVQVSHVVQFCWRSVVAAALVAAAVWPVQALDAPPLVRLVMTGATAALAWCVVVFLLRHPIAGELRLIGTNLSARLRAT